MPDNLGVVNSDDVAKFMERSRKLRAAKVGRVITAIARANGLVTRRQLGVLLACSVPTAEKIALANGVLPFDIVGVGRRYSWRSVEQLCLKVGAFRPSKKGGLS